MTTSLGVAPSGKPTTEHVSTPEPFRKLFHQGLITSHAFQRADRSLVPVDEVENLDATVWW